MESFSMNVEYTHSVLFAIATNTVHTKNMYRGCTRIMVKMCMTNSSYLDEQQSSFHWTITRNALNNTNSE